MENVDFESVISNIAEDVEERYHLHYDYYGEKFPSEIQDYKEKLQNVVPHSQAEKEIVEKISQVFEGCALKALESDNFYVIHCESSQKKLFLNVIFRDDDYQEYYIHNLESGTLTIVPLMNEGLEQFFDFLAENNMDKFEYVTYKKENQEMMKEALKIAIDGNINYEHGKSPIAQYIAKLVAIGRVDMKILHNLNVYLKKESGLGKLQEAKNNVQATKKKTKGGILENR